MNGAWQPSVLADPRRDVAPCPPVERVVVLATLPRTGSTLLSFALAETGVLGVPGEYLLGIHLAGFRRRLDVPRPNVVGAIAGAVRRARRDARWHETTHVTRSSLREYLDEVARLRTTPNGVFALKVHASELPVLHRHGLDLDIWGPEPVFVHLDRNDRIAQAVSLERAHQDGSFASFVDRRDVRLRYDARRLRRRLRELEAGADKWERYFRERRAAPFRIAYEDLDRDYEGTVRRVLDHLGFADVPVPSPALERQRDAVNDSWIERFRTDVPDTVQR
jgi:LPS sulfotransferase NodH